MSFFSKEQIIINNDLTDRDEILRLISKKTVEIGISDNADGVLQSFIDRENLGTTGFGFGLAIPHAKSSYISDTKIVLFKSDIPIDWQSIDEQPIHIAVALLVPESNPNDIHIKVLAGVSRKLIDKGFRQRLLDAKNIDELYDIFNEVVIDA